MTKNRLYRTLLRKSSIYRQIRMLQEECSELAAAVNHFERGKISLRTLLAEMADVEIMLEQMRIIFKDSAIDEEKALKLARLEKMIASGDAHLGSQT